MERTLIIAAALSVGLGFVEGAINSLAKNGHFVSTGAGSNVGVDTRKGTLCYLFDPIGQGSPSIPLCKESK